MAVDMSSPSLLAHAMTGAIRDISRARPPPHDDGTNHELCSRSTKPRRMAVPAANWARGTEKWHWGICKLNMGRLVRMIGHTHDTSAQLYHYLFAYVLPPLTAEFSTKLSYFQEYYSHSFTHSLIHTHSIITTLTFAHTCTHSHLHLHIQDGAACHQRRQCCAVFGRSRGR